MEGKRSKEQIWEREPEWWPQRESVHLCNPLPPLPMQFQLPDLVKSADLVGMGPRPLTHEGGLDHPIRSEASDLITGFINKHGLTQHFLAGKEDRHLFHVFPLRARRRRDVGGNFPDTCKNCSFLKILPEPGACPFTCGLAPGPLPE